MHLINRTRGNSSFRLCFIISVIKSHNLHENPRLCLRYKTQNYRDLNRQNHENKSNENNTTTIDVSLGPPENSVVAKPQAAWSEPNE